MRRAQEGGSIKAQVRTLLLGAGAPAGCPGGGVGWAALSACRQLHGVAAMACLVPMTGLWTRTAGPWVTAGICHPDIPPAGFTTAHLPPCFANVPSCHAHASRPTRLLLLPPHAAPVPVAYLPDDRHRPIPCPYYCFSPSLLLAAEHALQRPYGRLSHHPCYPCLCIELSTHTLSAAAAPRPSPQLLCTLSSEHMTAIPSRMAAHPSQPVLVAATSSGRCHVYRA